MEEVRFLGAMLLETVFVVFCVGLPVLLVAAAEVMLATPVNQGVLCRRAIAAAASWRA
jgi:hypothetical protein